MSSSRTLVATLAVLVTAFATVGGARAEPPEGRWLTQDKGGIVEIYQCAGALCGRLLWFRKAELQDNPQALDIHNPDPGLRNRPLCGVVILSGFRPEGQDHWADGSAYDPESGHTYSGEISMAADGRLNLRGYIGISLLGRTETWTRYTQPVGTCPAE